MLEEKLDRENMFGGYLRTKRERLGVSMRSLAKSLGISHVYLGEIERGQKGYLPEKYWDKLVEVIPIIHRALLEALRLASKHRDVFPKRVTMREVVYYSMMCNKLKSGAFA